MIIKFIKGKATQGNHLYCIEDNISFFSHHNLQMSWYRAKEQIGLREYVFYLVNTFRNKIGD